MLFWLEKLHNLPAGNHRRRPENEKIATTIFLRKFPLTTRPTSFMSKKAAHKTQTRKGNIF